MGAKGTIVSWAQSVIVELSKNASCARWRAPWIVIDRPEDPKCDRSSLHKNNVFVPHHGIGDGVIG